MPGRELPPADEPAVYWFGHGTELCRRMEALAVEMVADGEGRAAEMVHSVLSTDYNPLKRLPELGMPPQPTWARNADPMAGVATEPGS